MEKQTSKKKGISYNFMAAIKNTSEFKVYSHECRADVVEVLKEYSFNHLLDLDCGTGLMLEQIFEAFPNIKAKGFDYSLDRIAQAKKRLRGKNIEFNFGNARQLPYRDNTFDMVISTSTFHHYNQPNDILLEILRVLQPGGTFILCDTYLSATMRYLNKMSKPINQVTSIHIYSEKDIWQMLGMAGFTGIQWEKLNKFTFIAKATVPKIAL